MFQFDNNDDNFDLDVDACFTSLESCTQPDIAATEDEAQSATGSNLQNSMRTTNLSPPQKENHVPVTEAHTVNSVIGTTPCSTKGKALKRPSPEPIQQQPGKQKFIRRFPGPAGIIALDANKLSTQERNEYSYRDMDRLSDYDAFEVNWNKALDRLGLGFLNEDDLCYISKLTDKYREWRSLTTRVPFLIAAVKEVEQSPMDSSCVLADMSGEVIGSFHQPLVDRHGKMLRKGSTLLLRNISLLCPTKNQRKMYLNITTRSLLAIYSPVEDKVVSIQPFTASEVRHWMAENLSGTSGLKDQPRQLQKTTSAEATGTSGAAEQTLAAPRKLDDDVLAQFLSGDDDELFSQF